MAVPDLLLVVLLKRNYTDLYESYNQQLTAQR